MANNYLSKITRHLRNSVYIDYGNDYCKSILLAGTGRSGTTWISDIINYNNEYRVMFEPFYPNKVPLVKHYKYKQYLRSDNNDKQFILPANMIFTGNIRNKWIDSQNKKFLGAKRIIKDIRANFLLKWIFDSFKGIPIILAMRHPCAVANSRMKLNWETHFDDFLYDEYLIEDFLYPFLNDIKKAKSNFERQIFLWCIENYVPLKQFSSDEIHITFYENLCENPRVEIHKLFSFLDKKVSDDIYLKMKIPSSTSRMDSEIKIKGDLIHGWRKYISKDHIKRALEILSLFGLDNVYSEDSMPNSVNIYNFMED